MRLLSSIPTKITHTTIAFLERAHVIITVLRWTGLLVPMATAVGTFCALFLWSLDRATELRFQYPWLLFLLPVAGFFISLVYGWKGGTAEGGNNLIVDQIHEPDGGVPLRMAPLVLVSTVLTHLFGGSAGREGTAVQLGGSLASTFGKFFKLDSDSTRILLMSGIAAGFGAVFGTPIAGAVFAMEVLAIGSVQYAALVPCLAAALIADYICRSWGIHHTEYHIQFSSDAFHALSFEPFMLAKVIVAGICFGLIGMIFAEINHSLSNLFKRFLKYPPLRPALGGLIVIGLVYVTGTREYLGLGVWSPNPQDVTISSMFGTQVHPWSWALKLLFTVITLSAGFKGGEVTPLFFIGAALGNALSWLLGAPPDLFAALGFVAVFAGAANTPLACTLMGIELFGATHGVYIAVACCVAYLCSGHSGIYLSQRVAVPKSRRHLTLHDTTLREIRQLRPQNTIAIRVSNLSQKTRKSTNEKASPSMPYTHNVSPREIGMIRIYMKPTDRSKTGIKSILSGKPLYRELILAAKSDGIMNATAHHTHFGYSNHGAVLNDTSEIANPELTMCVELICTREKLEHFCRHHGNLLSQKVVVYKNVEHWVLDNTAEEKSETTMKQSELGVA